MLDLSETSIMTDDGANKRTVKINDFKAPEEWYQALKRAAQEDDRTISEAIIHLVSLGLKVRPAGIEPATLSLEG